MADQEDNRLRLVNIGVPEPKIETTLPGEMEFLFQQGGSFG
jgi:hypothetical protein